MGMKIITSLLLSSIGILLVGADINLHNPRGSNNKLNEQSNTVQNDRRLFDSQNNDNTGYQVGDKCVPNCLDEATSTYLSDKPGAGEGQMEFYEGSELTLEWTNQHGCGANNFLHCQIVVQYACDDQEYFTGLRDGQTTDTVSETDPDNPIYGTHESKAYYDMCSVRQRNMGLFLGGQDQNFNGDTTTAIHTRQDSNNNNDRYGWECPEERDYYPYWHPTGWRDIWIGTDETFRCTYYQSQSENVLGRGLCSDPQYNNAQACATGGAQWQVKDPFKIPPPDCGLAPTTRNNHDGDALGTMQFPQYVWKIPVNQHKDGTKCITRIRYNASSYDFNGWTTDAFYNGANAPVKQNPVNDWLNLGLNVSGPLRLAIDTAQFPRTFEDRSHVFIIRKMPDNIRGWLGTHRIINLNVRGRRGNIQQTFPSVEYDFVPYSVQASRGDYLHIQWVGSDANNQGNNGNGRTGTDRNNVVLIPSPGKNVPINLKPQSPAIAPYHFTNDVQKIALMAFLNQTNCSSTTTNTNDPQNCFVLNAAPATFNVGLVRLDNTGSYTIMSTRNNAFTNREQKSSIQVSEDWITVGSASAISIGGLAAACALIFFGAGFAKRHPNSYLGKTLKSKDPLLSHEFDDDEADPSLVSEKSKAGFIDKFPILGRLYNWYQWEGPRIRLIAFMVFANIAIWIYGYIANLGLSPAPFFPFAKGFGKTLDFNCSFILIPMLRNFLSYLRTTPAGGMLPLDDNIMIHKLTAWFIGLGTIGHIACHYADFVWMEDYRGQPVVNNAIGSLAGFTGHVILLMMLIMVSTALIKRKVTNFLGKRFDGYRFFMQVHKLWIPVYMLLWLHTSSFWPFSLWPLLFMMIEKFIQNRRARLDVTIVEAKLVGKDILSLKMRLMRKGRKFRYKAGQYLFLNCADVSETEWHPFTITSAPEESFFSCHIRCRSDMDWTFRLRQRLGFASRLDTNGASIKPRETPLTENETDLIPLLKVDGPYGSASEEVFDYNHVVLVGAGIGVTPFVSILKSISMKMKLKTEQDIEKMNIYFYWICRDQAEFDSFRDLFDELMVNPQLQGCLEVNTYATGEINLKSIKMEKYNQFSGKPNWNRIFKEKAKKHEGESIGVFLCGPNAIAVELNAACKHNSDKVGRQTASIQRTVFKFHKENF